MLLTESTCLRVKPGVVSLFGVGYCRTRNADRTPCLAGVLGSPTTIGWFRFTSVRHPSALPSANANNVPEGAATHPAAQSIFYAWYYWWLPSSITYIDIRPNDAALSPPKVLCVAKYTYALIASLTFLLDTDSVFVAAIGAIAVASELWPRLVQSLHSGYDTISGRCARKRSTRSWVTALESARSHLSRTQRDIDGFQMEHSCPGIFQISSYTSGSFHAISRTLRQDSLNRVCRGGRPFGLLVSTLYIAH